MPVMLGVNAVELLCSRLCHDLVSPVAAINNGVELMEEVGGGTDEALDLIADSAAQAARRLKMFRLAFGAAGSQAVLPPQDVRAVLEGWARGTKIKVEWAADNLASATVRGIFKLMLLVALLAEEALHHGGRFRIESTGEGGLRLLVEGRGGGLREEARAALSTDVSDAALTQRNIVAHFAARTAEHHGLSLTIIQSDAERTVIVIGPKAA